MKERISSLFLTQLFLQFILILSLQHFDISINHQIILCGILLCTVGVPHGANDYLYRPDHSTNGLFKFLKNYLLAIAGYIILWLIVPKMALVLFFVISFHHFGQSNFENQKVFYPPSLLWGIWLLAFPVLLHLQEAENIFRSMYTINGSNSNPDLSILHTFTNSTFSIYLILLILSISYLISIFAFERAKIFQYLFQFILVSIWYWMTPLLFGFIVVFCLWHALQSLQHQSHYFHKAIKRSSLKFVISMLPFSLIAVLFFAVDIYFRGYHIEDIFIMISIITLPHVVVMHRLYNEIA